MNVATRVVGFLLGIAGVFGLALVVGTQVGSIGEPAQAHSSGHSDSDPAAPGHDHDAATEAIDGSGEVPGGLMVSTAGYSLELRTPVARPGRGAQVSFVIQGPDGPARAYDVQHGKRLHLVAVRRDFIGFQHVHPELGPDGTWTTALDLTPGQWRVFADFKPTGADALTLGSDLVVPGPTTTSVQRPATRVVTVDGFTVTLTGDLVAGERSMVTLRVARAGRPVTDLQPYLGTYGHLVVLRSSDLAYLHVHPDGEPGDGRTHPGPDVAFAAEVPSTGTYHLYLDFKHDGVVRTAQFQLDAGSP